MRTFNQFMSKVLCHVHFMSPGRNLALKKNASQGEETFSSQSGAEKAVDGNIDRSCTQTKGTSMKSWWKVVLGNNLLIWRIEVHNKDGQCKKPLLAFKPFSGICEIECQTNRMIKKKTFLNIK